MNDLRFCTICRCHGTCWDWLQIYRCLEDCETCESACLARVIGDINSLTDVGVLPGMPKLPLAGALFHWSRQ